MISSYRLGYIAGRYATKLAKSILAAKIVGTTTSKSIKIAKNHKIDSNNPEMITQNLYECLKYLD